MGVQRQPRGAASDRSQADLLNVQVEDWEADQVMADQMSKPSNDFSGYGVRRLIDLLDRLVHP